MKKFFIAVFTILTLAACQSTKDGHGKITKIDDFLYEVTYTSENEDVYQILDASVITAGACSAVRRGDYYGRNLDFFIDSSATVVVHMKAAEGRLASLGVTGCVKHINPTSIENLSEPLGILLPFSVVDGINEKGVAINVNVVPNADHPAPTGTNPEGRTIPAWAIVRYLLDRAESADDAIRILKETNVVGGLNEIYGTHYMISDLTKTYIVEFVDNKVVYVEGQPDDTKNIMTNLFNSDLPNFGKYADGVERRNIALDGYNTIVDIDSMAKVMQSLHYTQSYDAACQPYWYSEFTGEAFFEGANHDFTTKYLEDSLKAHPELAQDPEYQAFCRMCRNNCNRYSALKEAGTLREDGTFWQTVSTSIYDLRNYTLRLYVQENYDEPHCFSLR